METLDFLRPAWAEIDTTALRNNFRAVRALAEQNAPGPVYLAAVVKADAYGHGVLEVARILLKEGADSLAVATIPEGLKLRQAGIGAPIMVLGICPEEAFPLAIENDLTVPISSLDQAIALSNAAEERAREALSKGSDRPSPVLFFLVTDTGMGRIGLNPERDFETACQILSLPGIRCGGTFTHLSMADEGAIGRMHTEKQFAAFESFLSRLRAEGLDPGLPSVGNSAALLDYPGRCIGLSRPGIILYGYHPAGQAGSLPIPLTPVMSVRARLTLVKSVPAGTPIGYGGTFVTKRETVVGTVPVGYADGYPRSVSGKGFVLMDGQKVPIIGRICMDQFMIDLTDCPGVTAGDEVILLGQSGDASITADDIASWADTISYEILCGLGMRLGRRYL